MKYKNPRKFEDIFRMTKILVSPKNSIPTFGGSTINYCFLASLELKKTILREGIITFEKPQIILAKELGELFEGFGPETEDFINQIYSELGNDLRMLGYHFKHQAVGSKTLLDSFSSILKKIKMQSKDELRLAVLTGIDSSYELSILKFTLEMISRSFPGNLIELEERGFFMPAEEKHINRMKLEIETLFKAAEKDHSFIKKLGQKLKQYQLFGEYEDRFFKLVMRNKV